MDARLYRKPSRLETRVVKVDPPKPLIDGDPPIDVAPSFLDMMSDTFSYSPMVTRYATDYGVPATLADAVIRVESNYEPRKRGRAGEIGLMQIKLRSARMMGYDGSANDLFNPDINIKFGMKYLAMAYRLSGGDTCGTILRYNAGHGATRMNPVSAAFCSKVKRLQTERDELVAQYFRALMSAARGLFTSLVS